MILFSLILRMIYILIFFQIMQVLCSDTLIEQEFSKQLELIFRYDFQVPPDVGTVLIWKIPGNYQPLTPLEYNDSDIIFGSEEKYLLLTQKIAERFNVYYWLGRKTLLTDKKIAVDFAILLLYLLNKAFPYNDRAILAREMEGIESESFQHAMNMFNRHEGPRQFVSGAEYLDKSFSAPPPNLYVIRAKDHSQIKKIPFSLGLQWLVNEDICLVLEVGYKVNDMLPINYYYGPGANENQMRRTWDLVDEFVEYTTRQNIFTDLIENNKNSSDFKKFVEVLEDFKLYNPNEKDDSDDHLKNAAQFIDHRNEEILLFNITHNGPEENQTRPIVTSTFTFWHGKMGYILDTKSVAGVFVILANPEYDDKTILEIHTAEEYLYNTYSSLGKEIRMRIIDTDPNNFILDFEINLSDYPPISSDLDLGEDEIW